MTTIIDDGFDATFYAFKPSGKWKYEGRGHFPTGTEDVTHQSILDCNDQKMPGMSTSGRDLDIVVIPDHDCDAPYAFPRMIKAVKV